MRSIRHYEKAFAYIINCMNTGKIDKKLKAVKSSCIR